MRQRSRRPRMAAPGHADRGRRRRAEWPHRRIGWSRDRIFAECAPAGVSYEPANVSSYQSTGPGLVWLGGNFDL